MIGLGFGLFFGGYWLLTYGFSQVRGCNAGFFSLAWPGSFQGCNGDAAGSPGGTSFNNNNTSGGLATPNGGVPKKGSAGSPPGLTNPFARSTPAPPPVSA